MNSKLRKVLVITMAAVLAVAVLGGCGGTNSGNTGANNGGNSNDASTGTNNKKSSFDSGNDIAVISREEGSGTRGAFIELFGVEVKDENGDKQDMTTLEASITNSTSVMMSTVAGNAYAIGYISLGSMNDTVKALPIDGVEASVENIKNASYKISRPFNIVTNNLDNAAAQDFINYILSVEGQAVVEENHYIAAVDGAQAYAASKQSGKVVVAGSSSVTPVMEKLAEAYKTLNPDVNIEIQQSDSSTGIQSTIDGICDIGMASRDLKDSETEAGLTPTVIAIDGIAVIVNNQNPLGGLSSEQVKGIFTAEIMTWSETE